MLLFSFLPAALYQHSSRYFCHEYEQKLPAFPCHDMRHSHTEEIIFFFVSIMENVSFSCFRFLLFPFNSRGFFFYFLQMRSLLIFFHTPSLSYTIFLYIIKIRITDILYSLHNFFLHSCTEHF